MPTTPPPEERPEQEPAAASAPEADAAAAQTGEIGGTAAPHPGAVPPPGFRPPPPGYPPPGAYGQPFAPVPRAPKVPWFNPDRRGPLVGTAVAGALILLAAGFGIGYAVAPSDGHRGDHRMERGYGPGQGRMGMLPGGFGDRQVPPGYGRMPRQLPGYGGQGQQSSTAPSAAPSASSTSPSR